MDLAGVLIATSGVIMTSALVVTVYGGMPRLFRKAPPKSEPEYNDAFTDLSVADDTRQPAFGDLNVPLPAMSAVGDLNIPLPAMRTVLGTIKEKE